MVLQKIDLKEIYAEVLTDAPHTPLHLYIHEDSNEFSYAARPMMVVCPGGGYQMASEREAEVVASPFYAAGYNVAVLYYAMTPYHFPVQPLQGFACIDYIRKNAVELFTRPDCIAVTGFSAGGHFAGMMATLSCEEWALRAFQAKPGDLTPNAAALCYPVLINGEKAHSDSLQNVSGGDEALKEYLSLEKRVDDNTPPCFLWHTANDTVVPVYNSVAMAIALDARKIPFELHIYEDGPHGMSISNSLVGYPENMRNNHVASWVKLLLEWLCLRGFRPSER